ncbi:alpha-L-rhamnosidase C-terminal domain-containing protein [Segetibacter koreensis]|uniref:alpha-L-rhamnosidase-related protein n=1 Tax=Segetibacter koreensis TaxID=398037 RepID=UPI00039A955F|nr:alpha-L-rhamnosidase C-terminal domain-containing protein [Segetibacter koreensis]
MVSQGPARGDLYFWNFETVDLAPYLQQGKNTVAALVWNEGKLKPEGQISYMTAFILQGNTAAEEILNTDTSWKSIRDSSYLPLPVRVPGYYVAGPGQFVNMNSNIRGWEKSIYNDSGWVKSRILFNGLTKNAAIDSRGWMLVPSPLPQTEMTQQRLVRVAKAEGVSVDSGFLSGKKQITVPANSSATLLLDQAFLTNAYPTLIFSKGNNAGISVGYTEGLYIPNGRDLNGSLPLLPKGNRNETEGKIFIGKKDSIISDGSNGQVFTSLWWRTYRYIQLHIQTKDQPLVIEDLYGTFTGYPFKNNARFETGNPLYNQMLDIGWRTARLCAFETYMDCPYYEQLQYIGDARIQALISLYNSGDDRLVRNAINLMDHSRIAEGITLSRYPTDLDQQIPTFSLWWIGMLHDYWMYGPDSTFIADKLPGERQVLNFFNHYQQSDGSLKDVPYWNFSDWVYGIKGWPRGMAPIGKNGESAILDIQLLWTYKLAAEMEAKMGMKEYAAIYRARAAQLAKSVQRKYWDANRHLFADREEKDKFSQHTNSLAILAGITTKNEAAAIGKKILSDTTLTPASIYFKYYVHQALVKAGLGNDYLNWLDIWKENINMGMTTWAETSDISTTRSDCHAWGSSPNIEFFRTVLGIDTDAPGFAKVKIEPHLGSLKNVTGEMPHPKGKIKVDYRNNDGKWNIEINLPKEVSGDFIWKGKSYKLKEGNNLINVI